MRLNNLHTSSTDSLNSGINSMPLCTTQSSVGRLQNMTGEPIQSAPIKHPCYICRKEFITTTLKRCEKTECPLYNSLFCLDCMFIHTAQYHLPAGTSIQ